MVHVDFLTVLVAAVVYFIMGIAWYSPYLFGAIWLRLKGIDKKKMRKNIFSYLGSFLVALILSYFLSLLEIYMGATSFWDGVVAGFVIYLGFVFTTQIPSIIWIKNNYKLFLIDNFFYFLSFMVVGGILVG
ncbi:MAG: hypothetical protein AMS24_05330 [Chlamydiae bacterium SM23_39]|nr:MAG: hypothetical protein AMS24_05330 [Chlamydiae bacterium SM23_39]